MTRVLVTGAGGFIGWHLCRYLKGLGYWVRGVDVKLPEFDEETHYDEFLLLDLRYAENAMTAAVEAEHVYALAANMGGMGFISYHDAVIMSDNVRINANTLLAAHEAGVGRYFFSSSACVYPEALQLSADARGLKEGDAYPAGPDTEYGWEKLFGERMCLSYARDFGMEVRIARFHNIYGTQGTWWGGREKAPAALCRKVAEAKLAGRYEIEVWGDGEQTRSFCHVNDCLEMIYALMLSDHAKPLNIGTDRVVSINELVGIVTKAAEWPVRIRHVPGPQGVRGRNADLSRMREVLGLEPQVSLEDGIGRTYRWIEKQVRDEP